MSNTNTSDVKQAAEHADPELIKKNLADKKAPETPESLTEEQKTPFIDEAARTDK